ncbi:MAG: radical SAM protein [Planctomycetota bacterium]
MITRLEDGRRLERLSLTLAVTRECNLRCSYCYAGRPAARTMPESVGRGAIERALASLRPGGELDLGFFGGEPLLVPGLIRSLAGYARAREEEEGVRVSTGLTTNGTVTGPEAREVLIDPRLALAVSLDGVPEAHDLHRRDAHDRGTSERVTATLRRLREAGREFRTAMVIRPETLDRLPAGLELARDIGASGTDFSLDVWTEWRAADLPRLERALADCARVWRESLPHFGVGPFDTKAALLVGLVDAEKTGCGFGRGEVAVAPSGRIYPCERLIGEDDGSCELLLPGLADERGDFLGPPEFPERSGPACGGCAAGGLCAATCRCNNYVRTGDVARPDRLLCVYEKAIITATAEALREATTLMPVPGPAQREPAPEERREQS